MSLREYNNKRLGVIYSKLLRKFRGLKNIGKYNKMYLSTNDLINDTYLKFVHFNDLDTLDVTDEELYNMFKRQIFVGVRRSWSTNLKENKHKDLIMPEARMQVELIKLKNNVVTIDTDQFEIEGVLSDYDIVKMMYEGYRVKEIMEEFGVSRPTIEKRRKIEIEEIKNRLCLT
jgi:hypothetical protein